MAPEDVPSPDNGSPNDLVAALPLVSILNRPAVVGTAFGLLLISLVFLVVGVFSPEVLANPAAHFSYCLLVALGISFFLFVSYPFFFKLGKVPGLEVVAGFVGPAAMFIALFTALHAWMPPASTWEFVSPRRGGKPVTVSASVARLAGDGFQVRPVADSDGFVAGFFVFFTDQTEFEGEFSDSNEIYPVKFDRGAKTFDIEPEGSGS